MSGSINWKAVIEEWKSSGLSQAEYCRQKKLSVGAFYYRNQSLQRSAGGREAERFVEVGGDSSKSIELCLLGSVSVRLPVTTPASQLAELIKCLR